MFFEIQNQYNEVQGCNRGFGVRMDLEEGAVEQCGQVEIQLLSFLDNEGKKIQVRITQLYSPKEYTEDLSTTSPTTIYNLKVYDKVLLGTRWSVELSSIGIDLATTQSTTAYLKIRDNKGTAVKCVDETFTPQEYLYLVGTREETCNDKISARIVKYNSSTQILAIDLSALSG